MASKNYYFLHIAFNGANFESFSTLSETFSSLGEAKKYVIDNYPEFNSRICGRRRNDNYLVSITYYFPNLGFKKTTKL